MLSIRPGDMELSGREGFRGERGGSYVYVKTSGGNAKLWRGSMFVYPTEGKSLNIQTDAN